jgi:RNA polymerase sigma factor (sigma-70 family)
LFSFPKIANKVLSWLQINPDCLLIYVSVMEVVKKYSDTELLEAIKSPQSTDLDKAIRYMYKAYYDLLKHYTCQNNGTEEDAQDVFQEVLVTFIDVVKKEKFRGESSIKTFLYSINRNLWLNELKKRGRSEKRDTIFENEKDKTLMDFSHIIAENETRKQILSIVDELGEICKKILLAYYYENLSMKEILVNVEYESEQALRNKKSKCLKQLEQLLTANPLMAKTLKTALQYE